MRGLFLIKIIIIIKDVDCEHSAMLGLAWTNSQPPNNLVVYGRICRNRKHHIGYCVRDIQFVI